MARKIYDKEALIPVIFERVASGESLRRICEGEGMPSEALVRKWADQDAETGARYARAQEQRADAIADEVIEIADSAPQSSDGVAKARLKCDMRRWYAGQVAPKRWGRKSVDVEHKGEIKAELSLSQAISEALEAAKNAKD